jgi:hypothetical protein
LKEKVSYEKIQKSSKGLLNKISNDLPKNEIILKIFIKDVLEITFFGSWELGSMDLFIN